MPNSSTCPTPWHFGHEPPVRVLDILVFLAGGAGHPTPVLELLAVPSIPGAWLPFRRVILGQIVNVRFEISECKYREVLLVFPGN